MSQVQHQPVSGFNTFKLSDPIQRGIAAAGFIEPRPVQTQTVPAALEGRDILGLAQTGTGKTAAYALPVLERLATSQSAAPRALVVTPTRELAAQVAEEIRRLARFTRVRVATLFGGVSARSQVTELRRRPEVIVACPGRLLDLMGQGFVKLGGVEVLVLDEADHMFDMGFLPDVRRILAALPNERQNLLFSATMPADIRKLAGQMLHRPHVVEISHSKPASTVEHALYAVDSDGKVDLLGRLLDDDGFVSAIVFTRTKHRAKRLARQLDSAGHRVVALQGNMSQGQRERAMAGFRRKQFDVLVATDIAARGIDVLQVSHVINFDMPGTLDAYTHRIGRTGRAEQAGRAYTFVTADEAAAARDLERHIGAHVPWHTPDGTRGSEQPASRGHVHRPSRSAPQASRPPRGNGNAARSHRPRRARRSGNAAARGSR
jgi:ATP-dependent RNA helicase RhlE